MSPPRLPKTDAGGDIPLMTELSDTFSTDVNNGSAVSPSEQSYDEDFAGMQPSAETSFSTTNSNIVAPRAYTDAEERAARLEMMLEEDGPRLFGIERLRQPSNANQVILVPEKTSKVKANIFERSHKLDKLGFEGYAGTDLTVFPVRQKVSDGENAPWRAADGQEATQPRRRNRQQPMGNTTQVQIPTNPPSSNGGANATPQTAIGGGLHQPSNGNSTSFGTSQGLHPSNQQPQPNLYYWHQLRSYQSTMLDPYHTRNYYCGETPRLDVNSQNHPVGLSPPMYNTVVEDSRAPGNSTSPGSLIQESVTLPSVNSPNMQDTARGSGTSLSPELIAAEGNPEIDGTTYTAADEVDIDLYNPYMNTDIPYPSSSQTSSFLPEPSQAQFYPANPSISPQFPSDIPMLAVQGPQSEAIGQPSGDAAPNQGEAEQPWDISEFVKFSDTED